MNSSSKASPSLKVAWVFKMLFILAIAGTGLATLGGAAVYFVFGRDLPRIITVEDYRPLGVTRILGAGGKEDEVLGEFYTQRRYLTAYDKIPQSVVRAFISAEDDTFFQHQGVNLLSILRASIANFRAGHVVQGGSTITQQVAKSLLLTSEKSFVRKIKEVILSGRIESNLSKQQILYLYLNQIYLGHHAYGVDAASESYFHKDISKATLAEAAILAGLPQAPGKYGPHQNPKHAKERQLYVLRRMYENKFITQAEMSAAAAEQVRIYADDDVNTKYSAYFTEYVRRYLAEKYGDKALYEDGLTVSVPITREMSLSAHKALQSGLRQIDKRNGYRGALARLKTEEEIEKYLHDLRLKMIRHRLGYELFMPDGRLELVDAMKSAGILTESGLLEVGETVEAVVTSVDDRKKTASAMIGGVMAELPMDGMRWARTPATDKGPAGREPSLPSSVVSKGDVVEVSIQKVDDKGVIAHLDQEPTLQGAVFSLDAQTGRVLAMEGGYDFTQSEFNRVTQSLRQPGSSFKPIVYSAGLERGFTPASVLVDAPIVYDEGAAGKYKPTNFEEKFYGDTTFRQALIKSRNVPTIRIAEAVQIPRLIQYTQRLGLVGHFSPDVTMALGSGGVSLYEMTKAYALFPRLGRKVTPIFITQVKDRDGRVLEEAKPQPPGTGVLSSGAIAAASAANAANEEGGPVPLATGAPQTFEAQNREKVVFPEYPLANDADQVLDPRVAYVMTHLMNEVVNYGTGHDAKSLNRSAAGKTGTTNDSVDAWFMGFTPQVVTGVWVGNDSQKPIGPAETGARAALPIWLSFMKEAVKLYPDTDFVVPPGVVFASIDSQSGKLAPANSSGSIKEAFIDGTQPTERGAATGSTTQSDSEFLKEDIE